MWLHAHRFEVILELVLDVLWLEIFDSLDIVSLLDAAVALEQENWVIWICG